MATNHNQVVYIPKGEDDDPHELPQQDLEGSTKIDHTLYSHSDTIVPTPNSLQKLDYIYQRFQDNEKTYESDPNLVTCETDNTLYPHINNDIEYGIFKDVIDSYYLDGQIKDDFTSIKIATQKHNTYMHHAHTPMIILHNISIIWKSQHSST